ncbi:MAG: radical SAM family heme chaperone HemW [Clostridia bacterium]|nr:radical SAM family heme chaperone HemW [Clostridia bacterium]
MKFLDKPLGLYLHIPFCAKKCAYCDFYSACVTDTMQDKYVRALIGEIKKWGGLVDRPIDTIYIGGGTPSVLGERIKQIILSVKENFKVFEDAEITAEVNPSSAVEGFLICAKRSGVNRLSVGVQSGNDIELNVLGRTHTAKQSMDTVKKARKLGFDNISLDLMICLPNSSIKTLKENLDFICSLNPEHISAYILKIEPDTKFSKLKLNLPDDDMQADQYLYMCNYLNEKGYSHYEISNFAKKGRESKHNLKYWEQKEYIGIGPSAHSFLDGKRFFYERDLKGFIENPTIKDDGTGGDKQEEIMLKLRLKEGIIIKNADKNLYLNKLKDAGYININKDRLSLTDKGMLMSNSIITEITERIL